MLGRSDRTISAVLPLIGSMQGLIAVRSSPHTDSGNKPELRIPTLRLTFHTFPSLQAITRDAGPLRWRIVGLLG